MADSEKILVDNKQINRINNISIATNILLALIKIVVGAFANSMALIADGIHSLSDLVTDLAVLIGVHFGSKEADTEHPYGHGRIETFGSLFIAFVLLVIGLGMIYKASIAMTEASIAKPGVLALIVAAVSIVVKELLYQLTKKVAIRTHSSALYANAWHHRSDALSSIAVVIGLVLFMMGFTYGDRIAAIAVGLMIVLVAVQILGQGIRELTEGAVDDETIDQIKKIVNSDSSIHQWHKLRTRTVGREVFLDLHILVDPALDISAAHKITENLENTLSDQIARPVNITIHIEPDLPEFRK